jgi:DNA invertase Pin-like site-specific DNA recombinase
MKNAYAYLRVSGKSQIDGNGFDRQLEEVERYSNNHDLNITGIYREEAISGTTDETKRPAFQTMISDILKNNIDTIIIEGLDRLAREYRIQEQLIIYLASKKITLISARTEENISEAVMSDPMRKAMVQIQGVFAELEKSLLVKKLRTARESKKEKTGKCEGRKSYKEVDPELVKKIKFMRRKRSGFRMSFRKIADELNEQGYTNISGKPFTPVNVQTIFGRS